MLDLLMKKPSFKNILDNIDLNDIFAKIKELYGYYDVDEKRRQYLQDTVKKYGYLPYPHFNTLDELTSGEVLVAFEQKLINEGVYNGVKFIDVKNPSPLARYCIKNSNWFKREGHNIKLLSLSALKDGSKTAQCATFIDWLAQVITLPMGNRGQGVLPATLYLIPFHPREFECAYLPQSSEVSPNLEDFKLHKFLGLDVKSQVRLFVALSQLAGHSVIYDILPQTGRFSKIVLSNTGVCRWFDINELSIKISNFLEIVCQNLGKKRKFKKAEIEAVKEIYLSNLYGSKKKFTRAQAPIVEKIEEDLKEYKILQSYKMSFKQKQKELALRAKKIIDTVNTAPVEKEDDIVDHARIVEALINEGLWPMPGGAWNSAGVPIFDKMHESKKYPMFRHYNFKGEDVTNFANLDCQTPYYFTYFESGKYNTKVIDFFLNYMENLAKDYNFDGFRVDHIDHIVDEVSQKNNTPISYRAPSMVLAKLNARMKRHLPYFATLAEYMLWDDFYLAYHKEMGFDCLWGNDIICQEAKTPAQIIKDNEKLREYNKKFGSKNPLSILKTYNNQDGEFREIDQYPGQLDEAGALFKWFKYKFLPSGRLANRPILYVDGDESFTKTGIEHVIGSETGMVRSKNWCFYEKFDAINRFVENCPTILNGTARLICQDDDGFASWMIEQENNKEKLLIVTNYNYPSEKVTKKDDDGNSKRVVKKGKAILDKEVPLNDNEKLVSYYEFAYNHEQKLNFEQKPLIDEIYSSIHFDILQPSEFKVYRVAVE